MLKLKWKLESRCGGKLVDGEGEREVTEGDFIDVRERPTRYRWPDIAEHARWRSRHPDVARRCSESLAVSRTFAMALDASGCIT